MSCLVLNEDSTVAITTELGVGKISEVGLGGGRISEVPSIVVAESYMSITIVGVFVAVAINVSGIDVVVPVSADGDCVIRNELPLVGGIEVAQVLIYRGVKVL